MWKVSRKDNTPNGINRVYGRVNIGNKFESESIFYAEWNGESWMDMKGEYLQAKVMYFFDFSDYPSPQQQLD